MPVSAMEVPLITRQSSEVTALHKLPRSQSGDLIQL